MGIFILLLSISTIFFIGDKFLRGRLKFYRFKRRPELCDDVIYDRFFAQSGSDRDTIIKLWHETALVLGVSPGKLRPTDRFSKELRFESLYQREYEVDQLRFRVAASAGVSWWKDVDVRLPDVLADYILWLAALDLQKRLKASNKKGNSGTEH